MKDGPNIAPLAALIGDPARANMLTALLSGKALTATELAREAGVTPQTASAHLAKMAEGGLLQQRKQGRHKFFALASDEVAGVLEGLMGLAAGAGHLRSQPGPKDEALRTARVCYNHLAGDMGVALYDSLIAHGHLKGSVLTPSGEALMTSLGIDLPALQKARAPLCRECLDWSARRSHLAGALGRALLARMEALGWLHRAEGSRVVRFTPEGLRQFRATFPAG